MICVQHHLDIRVREHLLEHPRVAVERHHLVCIGEIAVVAIHPGGNARRHARVQLGRVEAPLLAGVTPEELLIQIPADLADDEVLGGCDR